MPPARRASSALLAAFLYIGAASPSKAFDRLFQRSAPDYASGKQFFGAEGTPLERLGQGPNLLLLSGAMALGGKAAGSPGLTRTGKVGFAAVAAAGIATLGLKTAAGRRRPMTGAGPGEWKLFGGGGYASSSFPSGHTALAFSMAAVVAGDSESIWVDAAAYGLAGAVGASRVRQNQHWATDVLAGAALGLGVGKGVHALAARRFPKAALPVLSLAPSGVTIALRF